MRAPNPNITNIDFFGIGRSKPFKRPGPGIKSKSISFLGLKSKAPILKNRQSTQDKHSNQIRSFFNPIPMKTTRTFWGQPLFRKERITDKKLSKWGDADLDGTPNYFDCDARNWMKDAKKTKKIEEPNGKPKGKPGRPARVVKDKDIQTAEKETQRIKGRLKKEYLKLGKGAVRRAELEEDIATTIRETGKPPKASKIRRLAELEAGPERSRELTRRKREALDLPQKSSVGEKVEKRIEKIFKPLGIRTISSKEKLIKERIRKAEEEGKPASESDIKELVKLEKKRKISSKAKEAVKSLKELTMGEITTKTGAYTAEAKARSRRIKRMTTRGISALFGSSVLGAGEASRGGRPKGPTGKYMLEGKPVYEAEFQEYQTKQRALNRILPSDVQQAPLSQEQINKIQAEQMQSQMKYQYQQPEQQYQPQALQAQGIQGENGTESVEPLPLDSQQLEQLQQQLSPQPQAGDIEEAQRIAQQKDNILLAPNILKNELKATGGSLLTPTGPQILQAPQIMKGQMRTLDKSKDIPSVRLGERPQTAPFSDTYLDIEIGSNKPVVRRRITEKWMTGEAL